MMLGDVLAAARASAGSFQAWLEDADPALAAEIADSARREGAGTGTWVRSAVADFAALASDEDWATLLSAMRESAEPGTDCLRAMVNWRLMAPHCGCKAAECTSDA